MRSGAGRIYIYPQNRYAAVGAVVAPRPVVAQRVGVIALRSHERLLVEGIAGAEHDRKPRGTGGDVGRAGAVGDGLGVVERVVQILHFDERQDQDDPVLAHRGQVGRSGICSARRGPSGARREPATLILIVQHAQPELLHVVGTLHPSGRLARRRLHRRKQQRDQNADDCNDDQKLDKCETM